MISAVRHLLMNGNQSVLTLRKVGWFQTTCTHWDRQGLVGVAWGRGEIFVKKSECSTGAKKDLGLITIDGAA